MGPQKASTPVANKSPGTRTNQISCRLGNRPHEFGCGITGLAILKYEYHNIISAESIPQGLRDIPFKTLRTHADPGQKICYLKNLTSEQSD